jgi:hypothetical protein
VGLRTVRFESSEGLRARLSELGVL